MEEGRLEGLVNEIKVLKDFVHEIGVEPSDLADLLKVRSLVVNPQYVNTDLNDDEIIILAAIDAINDAGGDKEVAYDCPIIRSFTGWYKLNNVSRNRQGRKEVVTVSIPKDDKSKKEQIVEGLREVTR